VICDCLGCLLWRVTVAAGVVRDAEGAEAPSWEMLAEALEANRQLSEMADGLLEENARLRAALAQVLARDAERDAELEKLRADFTVLQRLLFGRSSEKSRPEPAADGAGAGDGGQDRGRGKSVKRGPGARAGRRDYSQCAARRC
jgi:transposase